MAASAIGIRVLFAISGIARISSGDRKEIYRSTIRTSGMALIKKGH